MAKKSNDAEEKESKLGVLIITIMIILVWIAVMCVLIKLDVGNFGSTVLRPVFKDVPVINKILPDENKATLDDNGYKYNTLAEALERIRELEKENTALREGAADNQTAMTEQLAEIERLKVFESNQVKYESLKKNFDEEVVFNVKSPDITEYRKWYESISPENAADIYERVLLRAQYSEEIKNEAARLSSMDAKKAAAICEAMTGDMDMVATLLMCMKTTQSAAILAEMDPVYAGKLIKIMYPTE